MSSSESSRHSTGAYRIKLGILAILAVCLVLAMSGTSALASGPASLVAQLNHNGGNSGPSDLAVSNGALWFDAFNGPTGNEPYRSDGSGPGTLLVADILPGSDDSFPYDFTPAPGGGTFFFADDGPATTSLFRSDGVTTTRMHQFTRAFFGPFPEDLTNAGSNTFFTVGSDLWVTDGTSGGTQLLMSFSQTPNAGSSDTGPVALTVSGGTLFFFGDDGTHGLELWKSDGTVGGTKMIQDTDTATNGSGGTMSAITSPFGFSPIISMGAGKVLFGARDNGTADPGNSNFVQLWKSDGTTNTFVKTLNPGADANPGSNGALVVGGIAYFNAYHSGVAANDGLFKSDGTSVGTTMIHDFEDGTFGGPASLTQVGPGTNIFFSAEDVGGSSQGQELWVTDGSTASLVKDIAPASGASSDPSNLVALNDQLYFLADDGMGPGGSTNEQLWRSGGTAASTIALSNVMLPEGGGFNPRDIVVLGSKLFMAGRTPQNGDELFSEDGTNAPVLVSDINTDTAGSDPREIAQAGSHTVFLADDGVNGQQAFSTDGTPGGTSLIKQVPGGLGHGAFNLVALGGNAVFGGTDGASPNVSLWRTDGTAGGTSQITTLASGFNGATSAGSKVFFSSFTPGAGSELWVTDGTAAGTQMVKDIVPGAVSSNPYEITASGTDGVVYFFAFDGTHVQLFKSDGTSGGTTQLTHMTTGFPNSLTPVGSKVFFDNNDPTHGQELWVYDPGAGDASVVKDINSGASSSEPEGLSAFGSRVVFFADDGTHGSEPWISDGTAAGTQLIKDINPGPNNSSGFGCFIWCPTSFGFTPYNGMLYFAATDGTNGAEVWRTDGTGAGTSMLKDINAGSGDANPGGFTAFNGTLYFSATNGGANNGTELWQTDGTGAGTVMTQDIFPGTGNSFPDDFAVSAGKLFFGADDGTHGYELWVLGLPSGGGGGGSTPTPATTGPPIGTRPPLLTVLTDAQIRAGLGHVRCSVARDRKSLVCVQSVPVFAALLQWSLTSTQTTAGTRAVTATAVDSAKKKKKKKKKKKTIILGTLSKRNVKAGQVRYTIKLTTSGRRFLRRNKKAKIVLKTTLTESNKHKVSVSKTINPTGRRKIK